VKLSEVEEKQNDVMSTGKEQEQRQEQRFANLSIVVGISSTSKSS